MKKPNTLNAYPIVLMHGAAGWGESEWLTKLVPYYGFFRSNVLKLYRGLGYEAYVPTSGPFTGGWARACDLYAQLKGGTTDYGKAYAERTGCERYGRTYKGLIPDWGNLDTNGKIKKICLISHSYGTPAMRVFISLLAYGSEEERAVTPENELSDLFKGGKEDWVHAATTMAGVHNGLSLVQFFPNGLLRPLWGGLMFVLSLLFDYVGIAKRIWDMKLDPYRLTTEPGKHTSLKEKLNGAVILGKEKTGSMAYDTSFEGAKALAEKFPFPSDKVYYFAHAGCAVAKNGDHYNYLPDKESFMLSRFLAPATGAVKRPSVGLTDEWLPSDGLVPVMSARAPLGEPQEDFTSLENCKPGIWYKMPIEKKDHHSFEGSGEDPKVYEAFMTGVLERMENLPSID